MSLDVNDMSIDKISWFTGNGKRIQIDKVGIKVNAATEEMLCKSAAESKITKRKWKELEKMHETIDRDLWDTGIWVEDRINEIKDESIKKEVS